MNILITGASGLIGSYLSNFFIRSGHTVIATARKKERIPEIDSPEFYIAEMDVLKPETLQVDKLPKADAVIHTATSNDIISKKTGDGILLSTVGTRNVLDLCVKSKIPVMVFFSTFQVYGTELEGKIDESTPAKSQNDYGLNHLFGEQYAEMYAREKNVTSIVVRPSNVYGQFTTPFIDRWTLVPGCFCQEIMETGKIILRSSGLQTRNFVNLENIGRALEKILHTPHDKFDIYNIASTEYYSMLEVAGMVKEQYEHRYNRPGSIEILSDKPVTSNLFNVDIQKLYEIGFTEDKQTTLRTIINELFIYIEKQKQYESGSTI